MTSAGLSLPRVLSLVGGLALIGAFFMPWFGSQGLLLSGQFLHLFLSNPTDLRRFLPGASGSPQEAQALRALVDLFPACGAVAIAAALVGGLVSRTRLAANLLLVLSGGLPAIGWALGQARLPTGATAEVGLWLLPLGSAAVVLGAVLDWLTSRPVSRE
jgi:hypothetical protein